jgi:DNA topoisomerase-1
LVIVESPAKAKTIAGFLGNDYVVESSIGHIRDLPRNAADVPAAYKGTPWARLGVDVENDFKPLYVVSPEKRDQVRKLKALLKDASELYLATDEDREGESIAWHLREVLSPPDVMPVKRMVFHEITRAAIERAVDDCRDIDQHLVDAQEVRRILDRLYGYEVSPVLWKKVMPKLSAGRVQSVACRIIVERERARMRFNAAGYWDLEGTFERDGQAFTATLVALDGKRLATGKDFDESGALTKDAVLLDEPNARALAQRLDGRTYDVRSTEEKPFRRSPYAPFMTSTLQQEAGRKLRFSSQRTMQVAQRLYENGYITYMRTDSTNLSETALTAARQQARELYGPAYVPDKPRVYVKKVKNAQEAHEAIRPAGDAFRTPDDVSRELSGDELRLYDLVWKRTVASQMSDATGQSLQVRIGARMESTDAAGLGSPPAEEAGVGAPAGLVYTDAEFAASGKVITFPGFMRAYVEGADDPEAELEDREVRLPALAQGENVDCAGVEPKGHATQPPARYTEASLVKALEELGVGRPSTYASIIGTIQDRGYVWKKGTALIPSFTAFAVVGLLEQHFGRLVDYRFTASMEDDLDGIATGAEDPVAWLRQFYDGGADDPGLHQLVSDHLGDIDAREVNSIPIGRGADGVEILVRVGRYGPYLQRGEDRASVPEDLPPDELTVERAEELLSAPSGDRALGATPDGLPVVAKAGRYGPYVTTVPPEGSKDAPRTASLFKSMDLDTVDLDTALRLLTLPRVLGNDPADGEEIVANNGRYGPYVKKGSDYRNIESEDALFTVTLEDALAIFAQPKQRRGQREAAPPLKELGNDPVSGKPMVVKEGRFGAYVTDGETNASLRKDDAIESLTDERAAELLADRRARGPAPKKRTARKAPAKKAAKKAPAKKAAKKAAN